MVFFFEAAFDADGGDAFFAFEVALENVFDDHSQFVQRDFIAGDSDSHDRVECRVVAENEGSSCFFGKTNPVEFLPNFLGDLAHVGIPGEFHDDVRLFGSGDGADRSKIGYNRELLLQRLGNLGFDFERCGSGVFGAYCKTRIGYIRHERER